MSDPVERYLLLGLRLGRHTDGVVDAYYGPPELRAQVDAEPLHEAAALADEAASLAAAVDSSDLEPSRGAWLGDQVRALNVHARVLAGEELSYADEVEGCFGVRPQLASEDEFAEAHAQLDALLPGRGSLRDRYNAWRETRLVPAERLPEAFARMLAVLRGRTARVVELPDGEEFTAVYVHDEPWAAFNYYEGSLRSRIAVNVDLPSTAGHVAHLAAHEGYPGHHTEHACKERRLVRDAGELEESIHLVPTPQSLVGEGIAEVGEDVVLDAETKAALAEIAADCGSVFDEVDLAVTAAREPLQRAMLNAAILVHDRGASAADAEEYLVRWGLVDDARARQQTAFVTDPLWRAYVVTYTAGLDLCRGWVAGDEKRLRRLLTERVRVADLVAS